ncbi:MAG: hypothetical protein RLY31_897 [Bacteroidota bacterium]|jgi:lysophospholipase L1-like esterase
MTNNGKTKKNEGFRWKYLLYSLLPAIGLLLVLEALASMAFYQMRGKSPLALISVAQYAGKFLRKEKIREVPAARFVRLPEHRKSYDFTTVPSELYMANCDNLESKPYPTRTDERAFMLPADIHADPEIVLAFLGGSTTECRFNEETARFPYQVGRILEAKTGRKVNSYNNGINSITSMNSLNIFVNKVLAVNPDYAVLMHNINDLNILLYEGTYWNEHPLRSLIVDPNNPKFSDGKYETDEWADFRGKPVTVDSAAMMRQFSGSLRSFIGICRAWNIRPLLMTQASRFTDEPDQRILGRGIVEWEKNGISYGRMKGLYDAMNECVRRTAAEEGVPLVDLAASVPKDKEHLYDLVHLTDKGSLLVADLVSEQLLPEVLSLNPN